MFIEFPCFVSEIASVGDYTVLYCIESMFLGKPLLAGFDCYFCCYDYCRNKIPSVTKTFKLQGSKIGHALLGQFIIPMLVQFSVTLW